MIHELQGVVDEESDRVRQSVAARIAPPRNLSRPFESIWQSTTPTGTRPIVGARLQRKYIYAFSAVSPHDGVLDSLVLPWFNTETMSLFLAEVAQRHANEFILMVMDQAGWHIADQLVVPENMRVMLLPPYSPELNPAEHLWQAIRQDCFANLLMPDLDAVESTLIEGITALESNRARTQSMTGFKWITSISLNAN